jgi:hypothetical protein
MGLLDDAIREHLELKRKRGADPAELTRAEQEALGPAVRQSADAAPAPAEIPNGAGLAHASEGAASGAAPAPAPEAAPETAPAPAHAQELEPAVPDPEAPPHEPPAQAPVPDPEAPAPPTAEPQPTVSFDAEDIFAEEDAAPPEPADEDVLEETPDFLQETPEHDRLWFEQKPPRDFDFDG